MLSSSDVEAHGSAAALRLHDLHRVTLATYYAQLTKALAEAEIVQLHVDAGACNPSEELAVFVVQQGKHLGIDIEGSVDDFEGFLGGLAMGELELNPNFVRRAGCGHSRGCRKCYSSSHTPDRRGCG